jgi:hypothetical protein
LREGQWGFRREMSRSEEMALSWGLEREWRGWEERWSGDLKGWDLRWRKERGGWVFGLGAEAELEEEERKERWVVVWREAEGAAAIGLEEERRERWVVVFIK